MTSQSTQNNTIETEATQAATFPIASETTNTDQQQTSERPNKYLYPPFAGYSGERYLDSILQQILPNALSRTWRYAVDFQAPGNPCYVGAARISQRVKPGTRKIEIDLHEFEGRGLMSRYAARLPIMQEDGTFVERAVVVKDFTSLYGLAYEYHLWTQSPEYIPPEREYADLILGDPQLYQKLIRFDNYRRMLICAKPGRKPQPKETHISYQCQLPPDAQVFVPQQEPRTNHLTTNNYINTPANISSPYRESRREENLPENTLHSTRNLEAMAIRKAPIVQQPETEAIVQNTDTVTTNQEEETETEASKSKSIETPQEKGIAPETAKDEKEYTIEDLKQNPVAMTAFLLDLHAQQIQQPKPTKRSQKSQPQRKKRGTPEQLAQYIAYVVQQLGGNPKFQQSDITRITKMYWAATQIFNGFTNVWFLDMIKEVFIETCRTRGVKRRVPYFFKCLEDKLELTADELAFIRSQEPLYKDGDITAFKTKLIKTYEQSGTHLEYIEWVQQNYLPASKV